MPKIVDHDERRRRIVDALWRLVEREGAGAISVRSVAAEAGMPKSTIGHYVGTLPELLALAVQDVVDQTTAQVLALDLFTLDAEKSVDAFLAVVPLTPRQRQRAQVWMLLVAQTSSNEELQPVLHHFNELVFDGILFGLTAMRNQGLIPAHVDLEMEGRRLHALVDGLSLQVLTDPEHMTTSRVREILAAHVTGIQAASATQPT